MGEMVVKLTELMHARDYLAVQREAQRILQLVLANLDVRPLPTGVVKLSFTGDVELLDRLAVWGCQVEDVEGTRVDNEDGADDEPAARGLTLVQTALPVVDLSVIEAAPMPTVLCAA